VLTGLANRADGTYRIGPLTERGVLLHRFGTVDEFDLHGGGHELRVAGVLFGIGGLLLSALPGAALRACLVLLT